MTSSTIKKAFKAGIEAAEITRLLDAVGGSWDSIAESNRELVLDKLTQDLERLELEGDDLRIEITPNRIVVDYYTSEMSPFGSNWKAVDKEMKLINKILQTSGLKVKYDNSYYNQRGDSNKPYMQHELVTEIIPVKKKKVYTDEEIDKEFDKPSWNEMSEKNRAIMMAHISRVMPRISNLKVEVDLSNIWSSQYNDNPWQTVVTADLQTGDDKEQAGEDYAKIEQAMLQIVKQFKAFGFKKAKYENDIVDFMFWNPGMLISFWIDIKNF